MFLPSTPTLAYHQITADEHRMDPTGMNVSADQFRHQMKSLCDRGYRCLPLTELPAPTCTKSWREKVFSLSFDDGYADFLTQALPILRAYGLTATVFVVTDLVGKQSDWEGENGTPLLTWEQIKSLSEAGITFGSHTCTHPRLTRLSKQQVWHELRASKEDLEANLDQEIEILAYPYGESNTEIEELAKSAGYKAAYGLDAGDGRCFRLQRRLCHRGDRASALVDEITIWHRYWVALRKSIREKTAVGLVLHNVKKRWSHRGGGLS